MLIIEVTNSRDLVRQRIGRLGERLIGRVVDAEGEPVAGRTVFLAVEDTHYAQAETGPEGTFEMACPAGAIRVTCSVREGDDFVTYEAVADTRPGETTEVVLRIGS